MKKLVLLCAIALFLTASSAYSQTMKVQSKSGDKTYNVSDVQSITFGKTINSSIEMVEIPTGTFQMGQELIATPVRTIIITKAFFMGKYEVTQQQYIEVIGENPSNFAGKDNNPVEQITWYMAVQFCNELSKKEGLEQCYTVESGGNWLCDFDKKGYRLPTEAEWEYACRAGTTTFYYTGNTEQNLNEAGWYDSNSGSTTHAVGEKVANKFGLYDMHGNVWEWCWDWSLTYIEGEYDDPTGPNDGYYRAVRGGSWSYNAKFCRSANRYSFFPYDNDYRYYYLGFRVARTK